VINPSDMARPAEAAVLAGVSVRDANRVLDEHILPTELVTTEPHRGILRDACALVAFYFHSAPSHSATARHRAVLKLVGDLNAGDGPKSGVEATPWRPNRRRLLIREDYITIDISRFFAATKVRADDLARARDLVVQDPTIVGGVPVVRGTGIPVHDLAASVRAGIDATRIRATYPTLTDEDYRLALLYAEAYPISGRPRRPGDSVPTGSIPRSSKQVRRKRAG
jgi:uncharacterized protein (DUF433 family)